MHIIELQNVIELQSIIDLIRIIEEFKEKIVINPLIIILPAAAVSSTSTSLRS